MTPFELGAAIARGENIPIPREVTQVEGCDCGGTDYHSVASSWDPDKPGCSLWNVPYEKRIAATEASRQRQREFNEEVNMLHRAMIESLQNSSGVVPTCKACMFNRGRPCPTHA